MLPQDEIARLVAALADSQVQLYAQLAGTVLIFYEYTITFGTEIDLIWNTWTWDGATMLFVANRYWTIAYCIYDAIFTVNIMPKSAKVAIVTAQVQTTMSLLQNIPWAVFSALRSFALTQSYVLGATENVITLSAVDIPVFGWTSTGTQTPLMSKASIKMQTKCAAVVIAARSSVMCADVLAICATWSTLFRMRNLPQEPLKRARYSLSAVLLRDGTIYFLTLLVFNALHLALSLLAVGPALGRTTSIITTFSDPITSILITRFLFDLQTAKRMMDASTTSAGTDKAAPGQSLIFARVVGSLSASLDFAEINEDKNRDEYASGVAGESASEGCTNQEEVVPGEA
ncbi:uncharacterized protein BXZ73DRAFT_77050 [Epithele typhae]|uniref:uncharacterized protein n=1 Tax=Epithele typhae TaxID=378194 RepID=UPI002007D4F1|nr:uncharacterized protein BXZ73DRAFT_77050 [Epithele typhae]KAH9934580.1 hypothetical protein BXZ73DRAFT_77050 [Epithele typhae]